MIKLIRSINRYISIIGIVSFFLALGIIRSIEHDTISLVTCMVYLIIFLLFIGLSIKASNVLHELQVKYKEIIKQYAEIYKNVV